MNSLIRLPRPGQQMDRLVARFIGHGSMISSAFRLPTARYTVFVDYDPADAVHAFALSDGAGRRWPDWKGMPSPGAVTAPIVQEPLPSGRYRVEIETTMAACSWDIQVVLNSMQAWAIPPRSWKALPPPPPAVTVSGAGSPTLPVERMGNYSLDWWLGEPGLHPVRRHSYALRLRAGDGHTVELGGGDDRGDHRVGAAFLGAGAWEVEMTAQAAWELTVSPMVGPMGGGAWGF